jgi:chromate transporter
VLPWARRMIVDEKQWMDELQFVEVLSIAHLLPGPNIVNVAIAVGARFHGVRGALTAFAGLMVVPVTLVIALGLLYARFGALAPLRSAFSGIAAVAAGMVITMGLRATMVLRGRHVAIVIAVLAFVAVAVLRWPLGWIVLALGPVGVAVAVWERP